MENNPSPPAAELPLHKGFASMRSMLAGVAETGSETAQRLEGFASVRSTLAGVAETGCKKTIPHRLRRSSLYTREPEKSPITEVSFAYFSFPKKSTVKEKYGRIGIKSASLN